MFENHKMTADIVRILQGPYNSDLGRVFCISEYLEGLPDNDARIAAVMEFFALCRLPYRHDLAVVECGRISENTTDWGAVAISLSLMAKEGFISNAGVYAKEKEKSARSFAERLVRDLTTISASHGAPGRVLWLNCLITSTIAPVSDPVPGRGNPDECEKEQSRVARILGEHPRIFSALCNLLFVQQACPHTIAKYVNGLHLSDGHSHPEVPEAAMHFVIEAAYQKGFTDATRVQERVAFVVPYPFPPNSPANPPQTIN